MGKGEDRWLQVLREVHLAWAGWISGQESTMSEMIMNKHRAPLDGRREPMSMGCKCMSEKDVLSSGHTNRPGRGKTDASPGGVPGPPNHPGPNSPGPLTQRGMCLSEAHGRAGDIRFLGN